MSVKKLGCDVGDVVIRRMRNGWMVRAEDGDGEPEVAVFQDARGGAERAAAAASLAEALGFAFAAEYGSNKHDTGVEFSLVDALGRPVGGPTCTLTDAEGELVALRERCTELVRLYEAAVHLDHGGPRVCAFSYPNGVETHKKDEPRADDWVNCKCSAKVEGWRFIRAAADMAYTTLGIRGVDVEMAIHAENVASGVAVGHDVSVLPLLVRERLVSVIAEGGKRAPSERIVRAVEKVLALLVADGALTFTRAPDEPPCP